MEAPLNKKIPKEQPMPFRSLIQVENDAAENLKTLLASPPIPALLRLKGPCTVGTDACDSQVLSVLLQQPEEVTA